MSNYKRRREDESTFGFGRYPKRLRRDCNGYNNREAHSLSVSYHSSRHTKNGAKKLPMEKNNLYHYSLSSELYGRHHSGSKSTSIRYSSNCSNASQQKRERKRKRDLADGAAEEFGIDRKVLRSDSSRKVNIACVLALCK